MPSIAEPLTELPVKLTLSKWATDTLTRRAAESGQGLPEFVSELVERFTAQPTPLDELSGDVGRRFTESGISEEELVEDLERAKHEMRAERRARNVP